MVIFNSYVSLPEGKGVSHYLYFLNRRMMRITNGRNTYQATSKMRWDRDSWRRRFGKCPPVAKHGWPGKSQKALVRGFSGKKKLNCGIFPSFPMDFPIISQKIMQKKHRNWKMMGKSIIFQFLWSFACFLRAALQLLWLGPWGSGNLLLSLSLVLVVSRQGEDGCNFRWSSNVGSWKTYEKLVKLP